MLPGKKYKGAEIVQIAFTRKWLIVLPCVLVGIAAMALASYLPNRYRSETLIMVVPQRVPEDYVKSTVTTRIEDRLQSISQQILSRTRLERVIQDFDLYAAERKTGIMEDIVQRMRKEIDVRVVKGEAAFRISYTSDRPETAMKVTERLASLFIDENLKDRETLAVGTNEFLEAQLQEARQKLIEHEGRIETYRKQYTGQLPSQLAANLQALQNTQLQIQTLVDSINRDRDRKAMLERMASEATLLLQAAPAPTAAEAQAGAGTAVQQLDAARRALAALELRLTPEHPDVRQMKRTIADLEAKAEAESLQAPVTAAPAPANAQDAARLLRVAEMRAEIESIGRQVAHKEEQERQLRAAAASYQGKIDAVPSRESELAELTRDYTTMQQIYQDLLAKKQNSQVAANLERRQIGEQFKILDPASLPQRPANGLQLLGLRIGGWIAGLLLGLGLVALLEYRDATLKTEEDVVRVLSLPVLALVPELQAPEARRRRFFGLRRAAALALVGGGAMLLWTLQR